jgi:hypothetical protein
MIWSVMGGSPFSIKVVVFWRVFHRDFSNWVAMDSNSKETFTNCQAFFTYFHAKIIFVKWQAKIPSGAVAAPLLFFGYLLK